MMPTTKTLIGYLPLAIFVGVMFWRMRTIDRARPLRLKTLWLMPLLFLVLVGVVLYATPPGAPGIVAIVVGLSIGAGIGWQRARLMRLHIEGEGDSAKVMVRQSRAALLLLMALAGVRTLFRSATGPVQMSASTGVGHLPVGAVLITDALLGFALGMILAHRVGLWRRARALVLEHRVTPQP